MIVTRNNTSNFIICGSKTSRKYGFPLETTRSGIHPRVSKRYDDMLIIVDEIIFNSFLRMNVIVTYVSFIIIVMRSHSFRSRWNIIVIADQKLRSYSIPVSSENKNLISDAMREKISTRNQSVTKSNSSKIASKSPKKKIEGQSTVRFILGNGHESISSVNMIEALKSTAPFYFEGDVGGLVEEEYDDAPISVTEHNLKSNSMKGSSFPPKASTSKATPLLDIILSHENKQWKKIITSDVHHLLTSQKPAPEVRIDYFVLCLACHFSSVATYVPTDVDSKIRGHCWSDPDPLVLEQQFLALKSAFKWSVTDVSAKALLIQSESTQGSPPDLCVLSGHDGEWLGVLCGALGSFLRVGNTAIAKEIEDLVEMELQREASLFEKLRKAVMSGDTRFETALLQAAAILTHNVGDVDQGLSYWTGIPTGYQADSIRNRFSRLAHERFDRYGGAFGVAKRLYKDTGLSAEGHRNYPLRECRSLRKHQDLLLPLGPWLEGWGVAVARHRGLDIEEKAAVVKQLLRGCDSTSKAWCVPNQVGGGDGEEGGAGGIYELKIPLHS